MSWETGSSPLARGTPTQALGHVLFAGLIPARAGNTSPGLPCANPRRAHPRSRGEHDAKNPPGTTATGSSPLARGTHHALRSVASRLGLIPARAGNTEYNRPANIANRAHPRSRGEHILSASCCCPRAGSSPLARGTQWLLRLRCTVPGLIPARAGNTTIAQLTRLSPWAHPRSRGEHASYAGTPIQ